MIRKIDWSSLWRKEDWWAVWLGFFIIGIAIFGFLAWIPKMSIWTTSIGDSVKLYDLPYFILFYVFLSIIFAKNSIVNTYGLEYVVWALLLGLIISNIMSVPNWLHYVAKPEL
ncbi:MAG: hypothetical protein ACP5GU_09795 [Thermoprotei archaeon]|jgi:hypothetical protein